MACRFSRQSLFIHPANPACDFSHEVIGDTVGNKMRADVPIVFPECNICSILLDAAARAVRNHLRVLAVLENAVQGNRVENIPMIESALETQRERSHKAMAGFREHLASEHGKGQAVAANGES
jgi:hypothetical protein